MLVVHEPGFLRKAGEAMGSGGTSMNRHVDVTVQGRWGNTAATAQPDQSLGRGHGRAQVGLESPIWTILGYREPPSLSAFRGPKNRLTQVTTSEGKVLVE